MNSQQSKIGTLISLNIPQVATKLAVLGYDFIFIDLEHGQVNDETIDAIIRSKGAACQVFIRIREITEACIKHALDTGCDGIIAPRVETLGEIETLLKYSFYPPAGKRSVGFTPANQYGLNFAHYTEHFKPILLPQIESVAGVELAAQLLAEDRIAGIFIGPYDLSMSLGFAGQFELPVFAETYTMLRQACKKRNKLFCTFTTTIDQTRTEVQKGTDMIAMGVDAHLYLRMYADALVSLRNEYHLETKSIFE